MKELIEKIVTEWWKSLDCRFHQNGGDFDQGKFESLLTKTLPKNQFIYNGIDWKVLRMPDMEPNAKHAVDFARFVADHIEYNPLAPDTRFTLIHHNWYWENDEDFDNPISEEKLYEWFISQ